MPRFLGGLLLVGVWFVCSAFTFFPVMFSRNGWIATGFIVFAIACLIAGLVAYAKRKDSRAYAIAAAPGIAFFVAAAIGEALS